MFATQFHGSLNLDVVLVKVSTWKELQEHYYAEIEGGFSKNHRDDDEGNRDEKGANIAFRTSPRGFNPGQFIEDEQKFARKDNQSFFQRPRVNRGKSKKFDIHDPNTKCWFENQKVGKHLVATMLPKVHTCFLKITFA